MIDDNSAFGSSHSARARTKHDDYFIVQIDGREAINDLYAFSLVVDVPPGTRAFALGERLEILLPVGEKSARRVAGVLIEYRRLHHLDSFSDAAHHYTLEVRPAAWRLTQRRGSRVFQDRTVRQVIEQLLDEHDVPFQWEASSSDRSHDLLVQYDETDWDFVLRLLSELGCFSFFTPGERMDRLMIVAAASDCPPLESAPNQLCRLTLATATSDLATNSLWNAVTTRRLRPSRTVTRARDFEHPQMTIEGRAACEEVGRGVATSEHYLHHASHEDHQSDDVEELAQWLLDGQ